MDCKLHFVFQAEGTINLAHATYKSIFIQSLISVSDGSTLQIDWKLLQNKIKISDYIAIWEDLPIKSTLECKNIQCEKKNCSYCRIWPFIYSNIKEEKNYIPSKFWILKVKIGEISYKHKESMRSSFTPCNIYIYIYITSSNRQQIP